MLAVLKPVLYSNLPDRLCTACLTFQAGSGKSELAKTVLSSAESYNARLIQSLTPKNQGKLSEVTKKPCAELSQIMRGE